MSLRPVSVLAALAFGCAELPESATPLADAEARIPDDPGLDAIDNSPDTAPTEARVALGRHLFYDPGLSANGTTACGSCHLQEHAFADTTPLSEGFEGGSTGRNSMSLVNVRYYAPGAMFWDQRAESLEAQVLMPIQDATEMGMTLDELVAVVGSSEPYPALFAEAWGDERVTEDRIASSLAMFVRTLVSFDSRYDAGLDEVGDVRQAFPGFTARENLGKELFFGRAGCAACHVAGGPGQPPGPGREPPAEPRIFYVNGPSNNGLDRDTTDLGLAAVTGRIADEGKMKSPSLRNVDVTGPYMHDGRFETLAEVVQHYNRGVQPHPTLDPRLRAGPNGPPRRLGLSDDEVGALVDFLRTLTDESFLSEPSYGSPF